MKLLKGLSLLFLWAVVAEGKQSDIEGAGLFGANALSEHQQSRSVANGRYLQETLSPAPTTKDVPAPTPTSETKTSAPVTTQSPPTNIPTTTKSTTTAPTTEASTTVAPSEKLTSRAPTSVISPKTSPPPVSDTKASPTSPLTKNAPTLPTTIDGLPTLPCDPTNPISCLDSNNKTSSETTDGTASKTTADKGGGKILGLTAVSFGLMCGGVVVGSTLMIGILVCLFRRRENPADSLRKSQEYPYAGTFAIQNTPTATPETDQKQGGGGTDLESRIAYLKARADATEEGETRRASVAGGGLIPKQHQQLPMTFEQGLEGHTYDPAHSQGQQHPLYPTANVDQRHANVDQRHTNLRTATPGNRTAMSYENFNRGRAASEVDIDDQPSLHGLRLHYTPPPAVDPEEAEAHYAMGSDAHHVQSRYIQTNGGTTSRESHVPTLYPF